MIIIKESNVKLWMDSGDPMLMDIANGYIGNSMPSEEELTEILRFFNVFAIGFREIGKNEIADAYCKRANIFAAGLEQLGLKEGTYRNHVRRINMPGIIKRIIRRACGRAAYDMVEANRETLIRNDNGK